MGSRLDRKDEGDDEALVYADDYYPIIKTNPSKPSLRVGKAQSTTAFNSGRQRSTRSQLREEPSFQGAGYRKRVVRPRPISQYQGGAHSLKRMAFETQGQVWHDRRLDLF